MTNNAGFINRSAEIRRRSKRASRAKAVPHLIHSDGSSIAGGCSRLQLPPDWEFAMHRRLEVRA